MGATSNGLGCQKIAPNRSRLSEASIKKKKKITPTDFISTVCFTDFHTHG